MAASAPRKKLIEVSIPLEAINKASAREKSIRHGHPSTLHLWWARRPLATCRAVLFAQLVDDPSAWPEKFVSEIERETERLRLHRVIEEMVEWPESKPADQARFERAIQAARWEIARSVAWGLGEEPPAKGDGKAIFAYLQENAPPVYDPFSGGGSIPLEAQRLGLRAYGSDLNPVAVLIGKALVEVPPIFAGLPPVNSKAQAELKRGRWNGKGAQGLAEDVRYYGQWMRDEAERSIGRLYPKAKLKDGSEATVIAWLWARTVRSPDPAAKGAMVPLVSSFMLATKEGKKAWVEPVIDGSAPDGWRFEVKTGVLSKERETKLREGTIGRSTGGSCILTGASMPFSYVREEGRTNGLGVRLMAVVAEGTRERVYLSPSAEQVAASEQARPEWEPEGDLPNNPRDFKTPNYGMKTFASLFTPRQLVALTTFSDLVASAREKALGDALAAGMTDPLGDPADISWPGRLSTGATGATAYADAVATYLAFAVDKATDRNTTLCSWESGMGRMRNTFGRQALPMIWDYAETNPFAGAGGDIAGTAVAVFEVLAKLDNLGIAGISQINAPKNSFPVRPVVISTDPPYYDNIGYADLSDFFYVWLKRSLSEVWPELFRRLITPKDEELVATPYRHGGKTEAEAFFIQGMSDALTAMREAAADEQPLTIYYAFKQSEVADGDVTSAGWASFLQAVVNAGLSVDGTWPVRTELSNRMIGSGTNALASSIVLVCRKRNGISATTDRAGFTSALRRDLPDAISKIRTAGVGPVDMQQSVIGPGMGVFTRFAEVLDDDDKPLPVKTALALINRAWEEIENDIEGTFDAETQVALAWFATYGFDAKPSGDLITLANAKNVPTSALFVSGVFQDLRGRAALTPRGELPKSWRPSTDKRLTVWECAQHAARVLNAEDGGIAAAGQLVAEMGPRGADARTLVYRLFEIATQKGWSAEALVYNQLAQEWPRLEALGSGNGRNTQLDLL